MRKILISLCFVMFSAGASAAPPSDAAIDELLTVTRTQQLLEATLANMDQQLRPVMAELEKKQNLSAEEKQRRRDAVTKIIKVAQDELSWAKMRPLYASLYRDTFTQEEIAGLVAFYKSPAGIAYTEKMPVLMQKSTLLMQEKIGPMMQKMMAVVQ